MQQRRKNQRLLCAEDFEARRHNVDTQLIAQWLSPNSSRDGQQEETANDQHAVRFRQEVQPHEGIDEKSDNRRELLSDKRYLTSIRVNA
jgi:hypothetical protein